jgi:hypothetical protein
MQTVAHESSLGRLTLRTAKPDDGAAPPLFRSLESALLFAYTWRSRSGVKAATYGEYTGPDGGALLLSVGEKKVQAEAIHEVCKTHLSHDQRALLDATHGGERGERHAGVERLVCLLEHINRNRGLVRMIVARDFVYGEGYSPSLSRIARDCGVSATTACRVAAHITPELAELRKATHAKLRPAFCRRGWVAWEAEEIQ